MERYSDGWTDMRDLFPNDIPPASDETLAMMQAARELELERQQICEWALREYLMLGGRTDFVRHLCSECGISYERVIGNT